MPSLVPLRLRAETMLRFHPIAQKQKTDLNIASVLVRAGGPGPGRPLRQSQAGNLVATSIWPGLGWAGLARELQAAAAGERPLARPPPTLFQPRPGPAPRSSQHQI